MNTWAQHLFRFYQTLTPPQHLPNGIQWLFPQKSTEVLNIVKKFLFQYYNDKQQRTILLGINPGRWGAGITGINFTAPRQLTEYLHIPHSFKNHSELSAEFIYQVIEKYGGVEKFYKRFFIGSVCPLGFIKDGKNVNYYDDTALLQSIEPFITVGLSQLISFAADTATCICIGGEKNFFYLNQWNNRFHWFQHIIPLPHPRFIMQYKRKSITHYLDSYLHVLQATAR